MTREDDTSGKRSLKWNKTKKSRKDSFDLVTYSRPASNQKTCWFGESHDGFVRYCSVMLRVLFRAKLSNGQEKKKLRLFGKSFAAPARENKNSCFYFFSRASVTWNRRDLLVSTDFANKSESVEFGRLYPTPQQRAQTEWNRATDHQHAGVVEPLKPHHYHGEKAKK